METGEGSPVTPDWNIYPGLHRLRVSSGLYSVDADAGTCFQYSRPRCCFVQHPTSPTRALHQGPFYSSAIATRLPSKGLPRHGSEHTGTLYHARSRATSPLLLTCTPFVSRPSCPTAHLPRRQTSPSEEPPVAVPATAVTFPHTFAASINHQTPPVYCPLQAYPKGATKGANYTPEGAILVIVVGSICLEGGF